jgi:hypothetical protein
MTALVVYDRLDEAIWIARMLCELRPPVAPGLCHHSSLAEVLRPPYPDLVLISSELPPETRRGVVGRLRDAGGLTLPIVELASPAPALDGLRIPPAERIA